MKRPCSVVGLGCGMSRLGSKLGGQDVAAGLNKICDPILHLNINETRPGLLGLFCVYYGYLLLALKHTSYRPWRAQQLISLERHIRAS